MVESKGYSKLTPDHMKELLPTILSAATKKRKRTDEEPLTKTRIKRMKMEEMRQELSERGLETAGFRQDLVDRLETLI
jgi:hypothetical protein